VFDSLREHHRRGFEFKSTLYLGSLTRRAITSASLTP
jgi:hypothetical protein